jgi:hypothetical protein
MNPITGSNSHSAREHHKPIPSGDRNEFINAHSKTKRATHGVSIHEPRPADASVRLVDREVKILHSLTKSGDLKSIFRYQVNCKHMSTHLIPAVMPESWV